MSLSCLWHGMPQFIYIILEKFGRTGSAREGMTRVAGAQDEILGYDWLKVLASLSLEVSHSVFPENSQHDDSML